ncbi:MAG: efflux RND transporter permease subunit, partial [Deltaproteobacteria bacterium]
VMLKWSLGHRFTMVIIGIAIFSTIFYIFPRVGKELVVDDDQSEYEIIVEAPEGSSLEKTDRILRGIEEEVLKLPGVTHAFTTIGAGETASVTNASIYVAMSPINERGFSQQDSMREARKFLRKYPELRVSVQNIGMISGGGFKQAAVNLVLRGPELNQLDIYSKEIVDHARTIPGIVDVDTSLALRKPEVRVNIDRNRASELGVTIDSLSSSLRTMVGGQEVSKFKDGDEQYPVLLRLMDDYRKDPSVISKLSTSSSKAPLTRLDNFVSLSEEKAPAQIDRQNREKQVTILANLEGMALGEAVAQLQKKIDSMNLPQEYSTLFTGRAKTMNQAMLGFAMATVLSMIFIYMVLASQFNSFLHPFTIMSCLPISLPFGFFALLATGKTLNVYSMIGVLMLFGIIKKNSILQVDYTNTLRGQGVPRDEAIIQANHVRLRPILMTTISIVFGMLPIALGKGDGSASRASMAMVMVGGQTLSLVITLLITPVVYSLLDDLRNISWRRFFKMRPSLVKALFIPALLISLHVPIVAAEERKPLSLEECISIALEKHPSIRASQKDIAVADEQYKEAVSSYYPKVSIDASYTRSETKALSFIKGESETYSAFLKAEQKVYDFGRTGGSVDAAKSSVNAKEWDLSKTKLETVYNVKESFYNVFKATGLTKVQEASVTQAESHLEQAKGFYEAGAKAKFDVTKAEVELNQAQLDLIKARNAFNTALATLKARMGLDQNFPLAIDTAQPKASHGINLEHVVSEALKRRPEIQSIDSKIKGGEANLRASKGNYYPSVAASASYGYYDQYPLGNGDDLFLDKNRRWNMGLSLNIPLFEGFVTQGKVSESVANIDLLKAQKEALSNNITLEVTQAYLELQNSEALISVAESGLNKARESLDLANGRYEAGVGTILEVTDAQAAYIRAETDLVNARYDLALARARLEKTVGLP